MNWYNAGWMEKFFFRSIRARGAGKNVRITGNHSVHGKVFADVLLIRVKNRPLQLRRKEQSGFTQCRIAVDRIFALFTLIQTRNELPLWIAYIDLNRHLTHWTLLLSTRLPQKIVDLMKELYTDTVSDVRTDGHLSNWFSTGSGDRQGCTYCPNIFLPPMDRILNRTVQTAQIGTTLWT